MYDDVFSMNIYKFSHSKRNVILCIESKENFAVFYASKSTANPV